MNRFVIKQSRSKTGGRYRVAVVETTDGKVPCRIDDRLSNVVRIVKVWDDLPLSAVADVMPVAAQVARQLNKGPKVHRPEPVQEFACPRCQGHRTIPTFSHVEEGVCFRCDGTGKLNRDQQWKSLYKFYKNMNPEDKERVQWLFKATPENWNSLTLDQLKRVERWVHANLPGAFCLPSAATDRLRQLVDAQPKPF